MNSSEQRWNILRIVGWSGAALVLLLPAIAMFFTHEVAWDAADFLVAALLLGGSGLLFELVLRRSTDDTYRTGALLAIAATFLLVWSNAAVGFVGSGANTANVLYLAIAVLPLLSALLPGLHARTLSHLMLATAVVQVAVTVFAFATDAVTAESQGLVLAINAIFVLFWSASAQLFRQAASTADGALPTKGSSVFDRFPVRAVLSLLVAAIGAVTLAYMVMVEQEPGLLPLVLLSLGTGWFLTLLRSR
ncbi:MAG TPA: hypothetical protein VGE21_09370 [Flavobacteriales bacterium]